MKLIAEALKFNKTITSINFGLNKIGAEGASYLAEAIKFNKAITYLDFVNNSIGFEGVKFLAEALKYNTSVTNLKLMHNKISGKGAKELALMLKDNSTITSIDLSRNNLEDKEVEAINITIKHNCKLVENLAKLIKKYFVDKINLDNAFKIASIGKHYKKVSKELLKKYLQELNIDDPRVVIDEINKLMKECPFAAHRICRQIQPKEVIEGELHISNLPIESINHITSYLEHTYWGCDIEAKDNNSELALAGLTGLANNQTPPAG